MGERNTLVGVMIDLSGGIVHNKRPEADGAHHG